MDKTGRRSLAGGADGARRCGEVGAGLDRGEQRRQPGLALAAQHAIDRPLAMLKDRLGDKRGAVPADTDHGARQTRLRRLGEVDDLRDVGEVVAGEQDDIRPPHIGQPEQCGVVFDLQVDQLDLVAGLPRRGRDQLEPQRFEPQEDLGIHQRAGMDAEDLHAKRSPFAASRHLRACEER